MSEQQVAFDDWQAEAEAVVEEVTTEQPPAVEPEAPLASQEPPKEKEVVVDPRQLLLARLAASAKLEGDRFESYLQEVRGTSSNPQTRTSNQILKNDKDFAQFARSVGRRLNDQANEEEADAIEEGNVFAFVEELLVLLYPQTPWQNMENVKDKLKIVKRERKDEQAKAKKNKEKEQREKKLQRAQQEGKGKQAKQEQNQESREAEDLFGGATFVNSKQIEQQQKKEKVKVQAPKPAQDDDDDFM